MSAAGALRLFVAAGLPALVQEALTRIQEDLRRRLPGEAVRWTRAEGIHLTLKFLGNVPEGQVDAVGGALAGALAGRRGPRLRLGGLGCFGGPRRLRVLWVGLAGQTEALAGIAATVDATLGDLGFPREERPFAGHLTLGRVRDGVRPAQRAGLHAILGSFPVPEGLEFTVEDISLMRSTVGPGGARYQRLRGFPLG